MRMNGLNVKFSCVPAPLDCWLTLRGIKTLELRVLRHAENACRIATALAAHPSVRVIILSGMDPAGLPRELQEAGAAAFVTKGSDVDGFRNEIRRAIQESATS